MPTRQKRHGTAVNMQSVSEDVRRLNPGLFGDGGHKAAKIGHNLASATADVERGAGHVAPPEVRRQALFAAAGLRIRSFRHRLADPDGVCAKWAIDGLIEAGVLPDDSARFVKSLTYEQTKIPASEPERTEIEIQEINEDGDGQDQMQ
jgi:hypothetical protein